MTLQQLANFSFVTYNSLNTALYSEHGQSPAKERALCYFIPHNPTTGRMACRVAKIIFGTLRAAQENVGSPKLSYKAVLWVTSQLILLVPGIWASWASAAPRTHAGGPAAQAVPLPMQPPSHPAHKSCGTFFEGFGQVGPTGWEQQPVGPWHLTPERVGRVISLTASSWTPEVHIVGLFERLSMVFSCLSKLSQREFGWGW